ncbi:dnaJ homolog subfamily C member 1-like [Acanthaster planci]|uniref:DnaJ homolog subfamily C member 1-like n=1 Tax=Acanthaster planci TaxID=133434 RepID=A0A8B7XH76_ACAPL|nr:dnaJ homolog subfamily C member 1-like [Acanthaster planci]
MSQSRRRVRLFPNFQVLFVTLSFVLLCFVSNGNAWDSADFELFDLVEEVQLNFYDVLGIEKTASAAEIRKAYRKQSLLLHPDKNKDDGAEEKFRQLVSVAEVLRDPDMRERYDQILEHGLPNWREPVFYYRRVRKMGLLELAVLLFIIMTVGHYIVLWSIYWERLLELESIIPKKKKDKKAKKAARQAANPSETDDDVLQDLAPDDPLRPAKPQLADALPCKLCRLLLTVAVSAPSALKQAKLELEIWRERRRLEAELATQEKEEGVEEDGGGVKEKVKKRWKVEPTMYEYAPSTAEPVTYTPQGMAQDNERTSNTKSGDWTQDEVTRLIRAMTRYPGGTSARWDKIAEEISRPVDEVTKKAKQIKSGGYIVNVETSAQGITGAVEHAVTSKTGKTFPNDEITIASSDCTTADPDDSQKENQRKRKTAKPLKTAERTLLISQASDRNLDCHQSDEMERESKEKEQDAILSGGGAGSWSQRQQKILEKALTVYGKGVAERWEKIAEAVPGKTKEECILRYKELVETIRRRKQGNTGPPQER